MIPHLHPSGKQCPSLDLFHWFPFENGNSCVKISPSGVPPAINRTERASNPSVPAPQSGTVVTQHSTSDTQTVRLISLLVQRGVTVSSAEVLAIEGELAKLGIQLSDIDGDVAFRAFLLHRNNIPLSPELLMNAFDGESTIFQKLGMVFENAGALLIDKALSGEIRNIIEVLVKDIDELVSAFREQTRDDSAAARSERGVYGEPDSGLSLPVRDLLRNSGLMLEWKLLAWYRSGGDPSRLHNLLHRDMKGILSSFLAKLPSNRPEGRADKKLETLERNARSLLDSIERRQISMILSNRDTRRDMYIELPFGDLFGAGSARIRVRGRKKPDSEMLDPAGFSLTFDVDTSNLGRVQATMNVVEKTISFSFLLENEQAAEQAGSMKDELVTSLEARGYMVGSVSIGLVDREAENNADATRSKGVDLVG